MPPKLQSPRNKISLLKQWFRLVLSLLCHLISFQSYQRCKASQKQTDASAPAANHVLTTQQSQERIAHTVPQDLPATSIWTSQASEQVASAHNPLTPMAMDLDAEIQSFETPASLFNIQVRGIAGLMWFPDREIIDDTRPWFNNIGVSAWYQPDMHQSFGIEVGQESLQMYIAEGSAQERTRNPNLWWVGAGYRYALEPIEVLGGVQPFAQGFLGATRLGPMGKLMLGGSIRPDRRVSFSLGLEGSMLMYQLYGQWLTTEKLGMTYAVSLHL